MTLDVYHLETYLIRMAMASFLLVVLLFQIPSLPRFRNQRHSMRNGRFFILTFDVLRLYLAFPLTYSTLKNKILNLARKKIEMDFETYSVRSAMVTFL